jgi:hypothetical protein
MEVAAAWRPTLATEPGVGVTRQHPVTRGSINTGLTFAFWCKGSYRKVRLETK